MTCFHIKFLVQSSSSTSFYGDNMILDLSPTVSKQYRQTELLDYCAVLCRHALKTTNVYSQTVKLTTRSAAGRAVLMWTFCVVCVCWHR